MIKRNLLAVHRHSVLMLLIAIALILFACSSDNDNTPQTYTAYNIKFNNIYYWVGSGPDSAIMIVQWNDGEGPAALAWGYLFNESDSVSGYDMINDIAKADKRFFYIKHWDNTWGYGYAIGGIGFNISGSRPIMLDSTSSSTCNIKMPDSNSIETNAYNFDNWKVCSPTDVRWEAGWLTNGYWSYWTNTVINYSTDSIPIPIDTIITPKWEYSDLGASSKPLIKGSIDAWYFDADFSSFYSCMDPTTYDYSNCDARDFITDIEPVEPFK